MKKLGYVIGAALGIGIVALGANSAFGDTGTSSGTSSGSGNPVTGEISAVGNTVTQILTGKLSAAQIGQYAQAAGFQGDDLAIAVAVALAESGGNSSAYNPETAAGAPVGMGSYGLWQIYLNAHPEFATLDLNDPAVNANAAFQVYQNAGFSFKPWSTFTNNAYQAYLDQAFTATGVDV